jgi:hypothetical protein
VPLLLLIGGMTAACVPRRGSWPTSPRGRTFRKVIVALRACKLLKMWWPETGSANCAANIICNLQILKVLKVPNGLANSCKIYPWVHNGRRVRRQVFSRTVRSASGQVEFAVRALDNEKQFIAWYFR